MAASETDILTAFYCPAPPQSQPQCLGHGRVELPDPLATILLLTPNVVFVFCLLVCFLSRKKLWAAGSCIFRVVVFLLCWALDSPRIWAQMETAVKDTDQRVPRRQCQQERESRDEWRRGKAELWHAPKESAIWSITVSEVGLIWDFLSCSQESSPASWWQPVTSLGYPREEECPKTDRQLSPCDKS